MANKLSNLVTLWHLRGIVQDDYTLYWHRDLGVGPNRKPKEAEPRGPNRGLAVKRMAVRKMIAGTNHGTRAEIIYRATEYVDAANNVVEIKVNGLINADLIFSWQNEIFIKHASLRQLEDYVS